MTLLDDFYTNHVAFDELCAEFVCKVCVAADEDMGFDGDPWLPPTRPTDEGDWDIPY